jgi:hypothetical protein
MWCPPCRSTLTPLFLLSIVRPSACVAMPAAPLSSMALLAKFLTTDTVAFLEHSVSVVVRPSGAEPVWSGPLSASGRKAQTSPRYMKKDPAMRRTLLNRLASYYKTAGNSFDDKAITDLKSWYKDFCNPVLLRAQASILSIPVPGPNKGDAVAALVAAKARPMLPEFVVAWIAAYRELSASPPRREPGPLTPDELLLPEVSNAIPPPAAAPPGPPESGGGGGKDPVDPSPELVAAKAELLRLQAELAKPRPSPSLVMTPELLQQCMASAIEAGIRGAGAGQALGPAPLPRLDPVARVKKQCTDAILQAQYFNVCLLSSAHLERVRVTGLSPTKKMRLNSAGEISVSADVDLPFERRSRDPPEALMYQQGWHSLLVLLMRMDEDIFPRSKIEDLANFWASTMAREWPLANKIDFVDQYFQRHMSQIGKWSSLTDNPLETDYLCHGKGRLAKLHASTPASAPVTSAPRQQQQQPQGQRGNGRTPSARSTAHASPAAGSSNFRCCASYHVRRKGPCTYASPSGGPCTHIHICACCGGDHPASACPTWDAGKAREGKIRINATGRF